MKGIILIFGLDGDMQKIKIFTHAINGLAESDFVLAAKIDKIN